MALWTRPRSRSGRRGEGAGEEHLSVEQLFDRDGVGCYSLAVQLLDTPTIAAEVVGQVFGEAVRSGPRAQARSRLLSETHRPARRS